MTSKLVVNTIEADTGISSVSFASSISLSSTSVFHLGDAGFNIGADTNINRPGNGVIGFNINGSEKVRIDSSGRVGLGTIPTDYHSNNTAVFQLKDGGSIFSRTGGTFLGMFQNIKYNSSDVTQYITSNPGSAYFQTSGVHKFFTAASGTANNNATLVERLRIDNNGNIIQQSATFFIKNASGDSNGLKISQESGDESRIFNHYSGPLTFGTANTPRLTIASGGTITTPYQFHIECQRLGNQTGYDARATGSTAGVPVVFNDVVRTRGTANSALNTSTGKVTVPVDGVYFLEGSVYTSSGNALSQGWFTEGSSRMTYSDITQHQNTDQIQCHGMHYLSANTEVGFHPYGATASSISIDANVYHTWFRVTLIG